MNAVSLSVSSLSLSHLDRNFTRPGYLSHSDSKLKELFNSQILFFRYVLREDEKIDLTHMCDKDRAGIGLPLA